VIDQYVDLGTVLNDHLVARVLDNRGNPAHVAESVIGNTVISGDNVSRQQVIGDIRILLVIVDLPLKRDSLATTCIRQLIFRQGSGVHPLFGRNRSRYCDQ
jgi:hypothetical protein